MEGLAGDTARLLCPFGWCECTCAARRRKTWRAIRQSVDLDWVEPRNFRVTAGTRIAEQFGAAAASQVLGNTEAIIRKHYMDASAVERPDASDVLGQLGRGKSQ